MKRPKVVYLKRNYPKYKNKPIQIILGFDGMERLAKSLIQTIQDAREIREKYSIPNLELIK